MNSTDFLFFQLKDLATLIIGLMGFSIALANLRSGFLKKAKISVRFGRIVNFARVYAHDLVCNTTVMFFNQGAQSVLIDDVWIEIWQTEKSFFFLRRRLPICRLDWQGFSSTENIADKGQARKIFTRLEKFAIAVVVPKYDIVQQQIDFSVNDTVVLCAGTYYFQIKCRYYTTRARVARSNIDSFHLTPSDIITLNQETKLKDGLRNRYLQVRRRNRRPS